MPLGEGACASRGGCMCLSGMVHMPLGEGACASRGWCLCLSGMVLVPLGDGACTSRGGCTYLSGKPRVPLQGRCAYLSAKVRTLLAARNPAAVVALGVVRIRRLLRQRPHVATQPSNSETPQPRDSETALLRPHADR